MASINFDSLKVAKISMMNQSLVVRSLAPHAGLDAGRRVHHARQGCEEGVEQLLAIGGGACRVRVVGSVGTQPGHG